MSKTPGQTFRDGKTAGAVVTAVKDNAEDEGKAGESAAPALESVPPTGETSMIRRRSVRPATAFPNVM
jgi:hypothetical protein